MGKCLVTTLKSSVNGQDLPNFGVSMSFSIPNNMEQGDCGLFVMVNSPCKLKTDTSYFTDVTGEENFSSEIELYGASPINIYIKKQDGDISGNIKLTNKYAIERFERPSKTNINPPFSLPIFKDSKDLVKFGWKYYTPNSNFDIGYMLRECIKINEIDIFGSSGSCSLNINTFAENLISKNRDYVLYPNIKVRAGRGVHYNNGSAQITLSNGDIIYIVFKQGGYEIHSQTADGQLLYDSTTE